MRRFFLILCLVLLTAGCSAKSDASLRMETYQTYYKIVENNTHTIPSSMYYTVSGEMTTLEDGSHRYYVIVDEPQIAMYDCVIFVVENNTLYSEAKTMMPCYGIFENKVSMVPGQVNREGGFVKGISVSGECAEDSLTLQIMVEWKDRTRQNTYREFLTYTLNKSGFTPVSVYTADPERGNV